MCSAKGCHWGQLQSPSALLQEHQNSSAFSVPPQVESTTSILEICYCLFVFFKGLISMNDSVLALHGGHYLVTHRKESKHT